MGRNKKNAECEAGVESLRNAIVLQAVRDYQKEKDEHEKQRIERFFRSKWFGMLTSADPEMILQAIQK